MIIITIVVYLLIIYAGGSMMVETIINSPDHCFWAIVIGVGTIVIGIKGLLKLLKENLK